ncbi:MAG TPA: heme biosynthesis HemY N-terminal domain-containing protein [Dokdonella sp.]|uniref:heme biosynthesis HemY N-terminal domain-containing protein n=1 Tax=Dokdonella sp. TaxID=2291710 RepID=UPI002C0A8A48|nr:heme biosynthesis HemY N-terminal domain-containing protein [Dokdonella sp.]HUD41858.1 heme biosynthesis HemY N-terminal domain-containing protein [Dokdonella sp.]
MRLWLGVAVLLAIAAAAAFGWHWMAADPGYLLLRLRGWSIETTVMFALVALVAAWIVLYLLWRLVRWPLRALGRTRVRRGQARLSGGLTALAEGRYAQAERDLGKLAGQPALRGPALLGVAQAAHARGDDDRANRALDQVPDACASAALVLRARQLLDAGQTEAALTLLRSALADGRLPPVGQQLLVETALTVDDPDTAVAALEALARAQTVAPALLEALDVRVREASLRHAPDAARLNALWSGLSRAMRRRPELIEAFARRAAALGQILAAMDEIQSAQKRQWSERLAAAYGELGALELPSRSRTAESWLAIAPNSPALLTTLGRLHGELGAWTKAEHYLERARAASETPAVWEALGDCRLARGAAADAARCYRNALALARGEPSRPLDADTGTASGIDTHALMVEERNAHGVPQLPLIR